MLRCRPSMPGCGDWHRVGETPRLARLCWSSARTYNDQNTTTQHSNTHRILNGERTSGRTHPRKRASERASTKNNQQKKATPSLPMHRSLRTQSTCRCRCSVHEEVIRQRRDCCSCHIDRQRFEGCSFAALSFSLASSLSSPCCHRRCWHAVRNIERMMPPTTTSTAPPQTVLLGEPESMPWLTTAPLRGWSSPSVQLTSVQVIAIYLRTFGHEASHCCLSSSTPKTSAQTR